MSTYDIIEARITELLELEKTIRGRISENGNVLNNRKLLMQKNEIEGLIELNRRILELIAPNMAKEVA